MLLMRDRAAKHRIHVIQPRNLKIMEKNNLSLIHLKQAKFFIFFIF